MFNFGHRVLGFVLAGVCAVAPAVARADDWASQGLSTARQRFTAERSGASFGDGRWNFVLPRGVTIVSSPVVSDGYVVFGALDGVVRALRAVDGKLLWQQPLADGIYAAPAIDRGRVFIPSMDKTLYAFRLADGALVWKKDLGGLAQGSPTVVGGAVILAAGFPQRVIFKLDAATGKTLWQTPTATLAQFSNAPVAVANGRVIVGANGGHYYGFDLATGTLQWTYEAGGVVNLSAPTIVDGRVYMIPGGPSPRVHGVDVETGLALPGWPIDLVLPAPDVEGKALARQYAVSSLSAVGAQLMLDVRSDDSLDTNGDGVADRFLLREYVAAVELGGSPGSIRWQVDNGRSIVTDPNDIGKFWLCPTPALYQTGGTPLVAAASTLSSTVRLLDASTGAGRGLVEAPGPSQGSPLLANGRLVIATNGAVAAFLSSVNHPPSTATLSGEPGREVGTHAPTVRWDPSSDADGDAVTYSVRIDRDGEVLETWEGEYQSDQTSLRLPIDLVAGATYVVVVRARDSKGALSDWSAPISLNAVTSPPVLVDGAPQPDLGAALEAAVAGQVIQLGRGTFYLSESLRLPGGAFLRGAGPAATVLDTAGLAVGLQLDGSGDGKLSRVSGLTVQRARVGISVQNAHGAELKNLIVRDNTEAGVEVAGAATAQVINGTFVHNGVAIRAMGPTRVKNSILSGNQTALWANEAGVLSSQYNDLFGNVEEDHAVERGTGDLSAPVTFVDGAHGDLQLAGKQASTDQGDPLDPVGDEPAPNGGRINLGAFGGTADAELSLAPSTAEASAGGRPPLTPTASAVVDQPASEAGGCAVSAGAGRSGSGWWSLVGVLGLTLFRRRRRASGRVALAGAAGLVILTIAASSGAATIVWGGGTGTWSTAANWIGGVAPTSTDTASLTGWVPLDRSSWTLTASNTAGGSPTTNAKDGKWSTRWTTGANQASGMTFTIDLGSTQTFSRVVLDDTGDGADYPVGYDVYVSSDGSTWGSAIASGAGAAALITLNFTTQTKRYIKIQLNASGTNWWSIREVFVYGAASADDTQIAQSGWTASASLNTGTAALAIDGVLTTRWNTGANAANGDWFKVDMGAASTIDRVDFSAYTSSTDYPPSYTIGVSTDDATYTTVVTNTGTVPFISNSFTAQSARYIKITCTGSSASWWSIYDFQAYGTPLAANIAASLSIAGITLGKGTITQATGSTLTVTGAYAQSGGTFTGGNSAITMSGTFALSGGTFTSTSDVMKLSGAFNKTGGTFSQSSGTVLLASNSNQTLGGPATFYNLRIEPSRETDLITYFKLDDAASPSSDESTNGLSATWAGSAASSATVPATVSFSNTASLSLPKASSAAFTSPAATTITVAAWVRANSAGTGACYPRILFMPGYWLFFTGTGGGCFVAGDHGSALGFASVRATTNGSWRTPANTITTTGTWYHVAATYDSSSTTNRPKLYINGTEYADDGSGAASPVWEQSTPSGAATSNAGAAFIGNNSATGTTRDWDGNIDDVRIYGTALSAAQIASLAAGRYSGDGGGATTTLGGATTVSNTFALDNGALSTGSYALTASSASTVAAINVGTYTLGSGSHTFSGGLTVQPQGTLTMATSGGTLNIGSAKTLTIDGTLNASSTAAAIQTAGGAGTYYTFKVGSTATATPTLNITGLQVKNTDTNGMWINSNTSAVTTFSRFDNIAFSSGTGSQLLQIYSTKLYVTANGCTFDSGVASGTTTYNVKLTGNGTADGETRAVFGTSTCATNKTPCVNYKSDDDSTRTGVGATPATNGAVVQFITAAGADTAGTVIGFPTAAIDWNTFAYYSTYVAFHSANGTADRVYVRDATGTAKYYWEAAAGDTIIGTPRWDTVSSVHYLYVATTSGKVYRLVDSTGGLTLSPDSTAPWSSTYYNCGCTISTPLAMDTNNLYWAGTLSGVNKLWTLGKTTQTQPTGSPLSTSAAVSSAAPAIWTSGDSYAFLGMTGRISKVDVTTQVNTADNTNPGASNSVNGRIVVTSGKLYAGDSNGYLWALDPGTNFGASSGTYNFWNYHDATNHAACGGVCGIQNLYFEWSSGRTYYGDQDGHVYVLNSTGTAVTGFPYRPGSASDAFATAPLYNGGVIVIGTTTGTLYVIDQNSNGSVPALIQTYQFGSTTQISSVAYDSATQNYLISAADPTSKDGKIYTIKASSDPTPSYP